MKEIENYLNNIGPQLLVHKDIKAKDLEACTAFNMIRKTSAVVVFQNRVCRDQSFSNSVINVIPHFFHVNPFASQVLVDCTDAPGEKKRW